MRANLKLSVVFFTGMLISPLSGAAGIDLHSLWDDRCAYCHGHAGDFARRFLSVSDGKLQGRHHVHDLRNFLRNHYLTDTEVDAVHDMLLAQASSQARFKTECGSCHGFAARLVREALEFREGSLYDRKSGRPLHDFLEHHRDLNPQDVEFYTNLLTRVAREVYRP